MTKSYNTDQTENSPQASHISQSQESCSNFETSLNQQNIQQIYRSRDKHFLKASPLAKCFSKASQLMKNIHKLQWELFL